MHHDTGEKTAEGRKGFTLVELAIVITIIGLLIGGVLKGQEMIGNARVNATIAQIQSFLAATTSFQDRFDNLPGDMPVARTRLPGCTAATFCFNGDGNGRVGAPGMAYLADQYPMDTENTQFWKHLALADLISGISPAAGDPVWGQSHPASPLSGGYTVVTVASNDGPSNPAGFLLRLHLSLTSGHTEHVGAPGSVPTDGAVAPASPVEAGQIDRKLDDGVPSSGWVRSTAHGSFSSVCEVAYAAVKRKVCAMIFKLR